MSTLGPGLYESLITEALAARLDAQSGPTRRQPLRTAEAADRLAWHISTQVRRAIDDLTDRDRVEQGLAIARALLDRLAELAAADSGERPADPATILLEVQRLLPDGRPASVMQPLTPLLDTTLLTNAPGEPSLVRQLQSEIESADSIDLVMAFIRRSGIGPLLQALRRHCESGRTLRVLTTTYTGSTEQQAIEQLVDLGADVRVSYDVSSTRLHAKAWLFHRASGFTTAYVGSSNLTQSAQVTGLEWNVRVSAARNPELLGKFVAVFESYWANGDFVPFVAGEFEQELERASGSDRGPHVILSPIELRPQPFQERLLELLALARERGHHRNLLVAATGTGKTVMAAVDYGRLRSALPRARLLFVAHREEIIDQSLATFRYALRDASFGEKWVGGSRPSRYEHVFASVQTLSHVDLANLAPDHFDVVIVDEFHHAAAPSYTKVLNHLDPVELLGLTATPERSDGLPVLHWFDDRIAAELRLWDAVGQQHLAPFQYYGIHDGTDLSRVPWRRGQGYDVDALNVVYTSDDAWARRVIQQLTEHVTVGTMRALGFCVSVEHARFMAAQLSRHGIPAVAVDGSSPWPERHAALQDLAAGHVRAVFSVDLFNEGVDVPAVDTVLLLRPTESPTLFLQQLGRGLRKAPGKGACTVLDFVGNHRREFRFDRKLRALLGGSRRDVERDVQDGFPFLPSGCSMQLDRVAQEIVLRSLREAIPTRWKAKVDELRSLRRERPDLGLAPFLDESGLDLEEVYVGSKGWSDLLAEADQSVLPAGPDEASIRRAVGRLLHVDDDTRLGGYRSLLAGASPPDVDALSTSQRRLLHMLVAQVADRAITKDTSLQEAADLLWEHPQVCAELTELFGILDDRIDHLHAPLTSHPDVPLLVHARYSRIEILAAMGIPAEAKVAAWQSGVFEATAAQAELLALTLDKTSGGFSPTTRYVDYAISRELIHWESQNNIGEATAQRYIHHAAEGRSILLFARVRSDDRSFWFLGPATYVSHTGHKPMAVTWRLQHPLPGDLYASFAAAVA